MMYAPVLSKEVLPKESAPDSLSPGDRGVESPHADPQVASLARFAAGSDASLTTDLFDSVVGGSEKDIPRTKCLLPESVHKGDGIGPVMALEQHRGKLLVVTLGITDVVERTGLTISVWGSRDQINWGSQPLLTFRQRQYCGVYSVLLNLAMHTDVRYLCVRWVMNRWGRGERTPLFGFEVFLEESGARVTRSAVA
jgi:hypothetical protein